MDELEALLATLGLDAEKAQALKEITAKLVEAETEKGKGYYRSKDAEALEAKSKLKEAMAKVESLTGKTTESELTLESLRAQFEAEKKARADEALNAAKSTVRADLLTALGDKVHAPKYVIGDILSQSTIEKGENGYTINGKAVSDFAEEFLKSDPTIIKMSQSTGTGDSPAKAENKTWSTKSLADLKSEGII